MEYFRKIFKILYFVDAHIILITTILCNGAVVSSQHTGILREYCNQNFQPVCTGDQVIIMQHALYGRIKVGRCMKRDYGMDSCYINELQSFDKLCSGKLKCEVGIPNIKMTSKVKCLEDLSPYLEASYTCQKVYIPPKQRCIGLEKVPVKKKPSYLASIVSPKTSCGINDSPWVLEAQPGQTINITLLDFGWVNSTEGQSKRCPRKYGYILDMETDYVTNICGGKNRLHHVYKSVGHSLQIVLEAANVQNYRFLIQYEAFGCPKYTPPKYSWVQKDNNSLVIGCEYSEKTWNLRCVDDMWFGVVGNCTPPPVTKPVIIQVPEIQVEHVVSEDQDQLLHVSNNHVAVFSMACVTLLICCSIVILGIFCTKRYEAKILKHNSKYTSGRTTYFPTLPTHKSSVIYKPTGTTETIPFGTIPSYAFPAPKEERGPKVPQRNPSYNRDSAMVRSTGGDSDYLTPQTGEGEEVLYYILETPGENNIGHMSEEMYQSIHLNNSLSSNKT